MVAAIEPSSADCFADPLGGLSDAAWDDLAGDRFYSSALWIRLCALESGGPSGAVHTELPGGRRAAVPICAMDGGQNTNYRWQDVLAKHDLPAPPADGILLGQRRGYLHHLLATPSADPTAAAASLLGAVRRVRAPHGETRAQVAMYFTTADVSALRAAGVTTMPVALAADAAIEVPDGGWEAWLESLSGHRRRTVGREVARFERAGYRVEHSLLSESYQDVARLTAHTQTKYGHQVDLAAFTEGFRRHAEVAGAAAEVLLLRDPVDGTAVGCCLYCRSGSTVYGRAVGFDYDRLTGSTEYPNLAYYSLLRLPGVRRLHLGMSAAEAKVLRGARLSPLWLLDLSADSVLAGRDEQIRAHNRAFVEGLEQSLPAVRDALELEQWQAFG